MPGLRPPLMPRRPKTTATTATAPRAGLGPGIRGLTMRDLDRRRHWEGGFFLVAFTACVPAANWMIGNLGTVCVPDGHCLIPVGHGLKEPSGVLIVGLALVLRALRLAERRGGDEGGR